MYYHFAILLLFRPFIKIKFIGSQISPREVCIQAADNIASLVRSYDQLYTLRRTPSFVPYIVLTSSIIHLVAAKGSSDGVQQIKRGYSDLKSMEECHGFAKLALQVMRSLARTWEIDLEHNKDDEEGKEDEESNICKPSTSSLNLFCPIIDSSFVTNISLTDTSKNPLFAPFPMQGKPLLMTGPEMGENGFAVNT
jgi:hypothetical protein